MRHTLLILLALVSFTLADGTLKLLTTNYEVGQFCRQEPFIVDSLRAVDFEINLDYNYALQREAGNSKSYTLTEIQMITMRNHLTISFNMLDKDNVYHVYLDITTGKMFMLHPANCTFEIFDFDLVTM